MKMGVLEGLLFVTGEDGLSLEMIEKLLEASKDEALKLLKQYHTIENLNDHLDELKGKMGEKIRDNIDQGLLSKKIATIIKKFLIVSKSLILVIFLLSFLLSFGISFPPNNYYTNNLTYYKK